MKTWQHLRTASTRTVTGLSVLSTDGELEARTYTHVDGAYDEILHLVHVRRTDGRTPTPRDLDCAIAAIERYCLGHLARFNCEIVEIHALPDRGPVDPDLEETPILTQRRTGTERVAV